MSLINAINDSNMHPKVKRSCTFCWYALYSNLLLYCYEANADGDKMKTNATELQM